MKNLPNLICVFRTVMSIVIVLIVLNNSENKDLLLWMFWLTWVVILLDGLDGIVARALKAETDFGAFFDIACDRITELVYIALFVTLYWIPFWILVVFLVRGILVDGIRSFALKEGKTAFGEKSMMQNKFGNFLTSSRFMRASYGGIKAFAFAFMFLSQSYYPQLLPFEYSLIYLMTFYCVIRGLPVIIEGKRFFT